MDFFKYKFKRYGPSPIVLYIKLCLLLKCGHVPEAAFDKHDIIKATENTHHISLLRTVEFYQNEVTVGSTFDFRSRLLILSRSHF